MKITLYVDVATEEHRPAGELLAMAMDALCGGLEYAPELMGCSRLHSVEFGLPQQLDDDGGDE